MLFFPRLMPRDGGGRDCV